MKIVIIAMNDDAIVDHGAYENQLYTGGKTLCGRVLKGIKWFNRGWEDFTGTANYHCKLCTKKLKEINNV